jgi:cbb3-type cytochrome oxidase maturation protein
MTVLLLMIPLSLLFVGAAAVVFFWAVDHDQFDDLGTPALLPLDDPPGDDVAADADADAVAAPAADMRP